jgi:hypothetical protein
MYTGLRQQVKLIGESLDDGETYRGSCPSCGRDDVFTVSKDGDCILFNCYRASCAYHGRIGGIHSTVSSRVILEVPEKRKKKISPFTGELEELNEYWRQYLRDSIGWTDSHITLGSPYYAPNEGRIAYPIYGPMGTRRGWILRYYGDSDPQRKAITRLDVAEPHISWYRVQPMVPNPKAIIVEDIPSAVRAAMYVPNAIAINGTGVGEEYAQEISAHVREVIWALDKDATAMAIKWHKRYSIHFDKSQVLVLDKDIKDMDEESLKELLVPYGTQGEMIECREESTRGGD